MNSLTFDEKGFLQRQLVRLVGDVKELDTNLESKLREILPNPNAEEVIKTMQRKRSLAQALAAHNFIELESPIRDAVEHIESEGHTLIPLSSLEKNNSKVLAAIALFRTRILMGLQYFIALLLLSQITTIILSRSLLENFDGNLNLTGGELPPFSQTAIAWYNSMLSPPIINGLLLAFVAAVFFASLYLSQSRQSINVLARVPGLGSMAKFIQQFRALTIIELYRQSQLSLAKALGNVRVEKDLPKPLELQLRQAEATGTLKDELHYQIEKALDNSERKAVNAAKVVVAIVGSLTVFIVVTTLLATYLSIFTLGANF